MLYITRLVTAVIKGFPYKVLSIFLATDNECTIAAIETQDRVLQAWFANRVAEIVNHMKSWERKKVEVEKIHHWPGLSNVADLATKGKASLDNIGPGSSWQRGPTEASFPRESWPASREFWRELPDNEVKLPRCRYLSNTTHRGGILVGPSQDGRVASPGSSQERSSSALGMAGSLLQITHYTRQGEICIVPSLNEKFMFTEADLKYLIRLSIILARII